MEQSTAESFRHTQVFELHRLPEQRTGSRGRSRPIGDIPQPVMASADKENGFYRCHPTSQEPPFKAQTSILSTRSNGPNNINIVRQPPKKFTYNIPGIGDDDVFYPPSTVTTSPSPPNFRQSDGRTAREIRQELKKVYNRVIENDRRSRLGYRSASSQPTSYPATLLRQNNQFPTTSRSNRISPEPVISHRGPPPNALVKHRASSQQQHRLFK